MKFPKRIIISIGKLISVMNWYNAKLSSNLIFQW
jgi:hypothetical protein